MDNYNNGHEYQHSTSYYQYDQPIDGLGLMDNINQLVDSSAMNSPIDAPVNFNLTNDNVYGDFYGHFLPPVDHFNFGPPMDHTDHFRVFEEVAARDKEEEDSGTTTTTTDALPKKKGDDRSKTLISERTRRVKMKEKLYALRSLVPNITKMDKASIVGDAVSYVQDMQLQAERLKGEIADLELSFSRGDKHEAQTSQNKETIFCPIVKKIFKMKVVQVEERGFFVKIMSNKGRGVAVSLHNAMESFANVTIQSSNLDASAENYVFTFTMHIMEGVMMDVSLPNIQLWIASSFLDQGFEFDTSQFS